MTRRLLIRPGAIGDCIVSFPALEFLKADYTEVWISSPVVPLVRFADCVRSIASTQLDLVALGDSPFPLQLAAKLEQFDEVISWYGTNRPEFRNAVTAKHPHWTFHPALPGPECSENVVDFLLRQAGAPPGLLPRIALPPAPYRGSLIIHPFSGSPSKNWPLERYRQLAVNSKLPVEWTAGPDEPLAEATRFENLLGLACWMTGAAAYLGNDSGISHLAAALGLPTLVLFGPTNPTVWAPRGPNVTILHRQ